VLCVAYAWRMPQDPYKKNVCICEHLGTQNFRNCAQSLLNTALSSNNASGFRKNSFSLNKPHRKKPQGLICMHWYFCSEKLRYEVVAISSHGTIRRFYFDNTVNTNRYLTMLPNNLTPQLFATGIPKHTQWSPHDGVKSRKLMWFLISFTKPSVTE
jgi:hypothetical protein